MWKDGLRFVWYAESADGDFEMVSPETCVCGLRIFEQAVVGSLCPEYLLALYVEVR